MVVLCGTSEYEQTIPVTDHRPTHGTMKKRHHNTDRHKSKNTIKIQQATSYLFLSSILVKLERTQRTSQNQDLTTTLPPHTQSTKCVWGGGGGKINIDPPTTDSHLGGRGLCFPSQDAVLGHSQPTSET